MQRFANPGSNVDSLTNAFLFLYENIEAEQAFQLYDMQELLVPNGYISSSGAIGIEALLRGANSDPSRDTSYNQCKMYAELFRLLGWIQSTSSALLYCFTPLGKQLANATRNSRGLVSECLLGIEFPTGVMEVDGNRKLRPFAGIIKTMATLDGVLTRDEMSVGPLYMDSDYDQDSFGAMCEELRELRRDHKAFQDKLTWCLKNRNPRPISWTTAKNYTRFILGSLKWMDWIETARDSRHYSRPTKTFRLTETGREILHRIDAARDIRAWDIENTGLRLEELCKYSYYNILNRSGFNIDSVQQQYEALESEVEQHLGTTEILFSPFQALSSGELSRIFEYELPEEIRQSIYSPDNVEQEDDRQRMHTALLSTVPSSGGEVDRENDLYHVLKAHLELSDEEIILQLKEQYRTYTQADYYSLIGQIFTILGLQCEVSPAGVNSRRWDAILTTDDDSIPIEIKSPTEELHISVKAIRQAVENKIILQSRQSLPNVWETASLAVGFELPATRAEVDELIDNFQSTFDIKVGVLGIDYLLKLALDCVRNDHNVAFDTVKTLIGIIDG